jgi:GNAT superfamily N-acetyltransferase
MKIRVAATEDVVQMHRVRTSVHENRLSDPSRVQSLHYHAMLRSGRGWVCEIEGRIVGFAIADLDRESVWALFVDPAYERRGVGRLLHDAAVDWLFASGAASISLTTDPNTRAEHFYQSAGWTCAGQTENGEMRYDLIPERFVRTLNGAS